MPCLSRLWLKLRGEQGSGPKGVDDLCFHTYVESGPLGWDLGLENGIWASRLGFEGGDVGGGEGENPPYV